MNLLLDTHALLWWLGGDPTLSTPAQESIADETNRVLVSAASAWEIAIKRQLGTLEAPEGLASVVEASDLEPLPITLTHAEVAGALPRLHSDPFDRMLVAQAMAEELTIVTRDPRLAPYGVPTLEA